MKVNLEILNQYLTSNEKVISFLYCAIQLRYISRYGILAATNEKLLFCSDHMVGNGFTFEFKYSDISLFKERDGLIQNILPFTCKITMYYQDQEFVVFNNFTDSKKINEFYKIVKSKLQD
jgi:hypothetical protein